MRNDQLYKLPEGCAYFCYMARQMRFQRPIPNVHYALLLIALCAIGLSHERAIPGKLAQQWSGFQQSHAAGLLCNRDECGHERLVTDKVHSSIDGSGPGNSRNVMLDVTDWAKGTVSLDPEIVFTNQRSPSVPVATLKDVVLSVGRLEPPFDPVIFEYEVLVPAETSAIQTSVVFPKQDERNYVVKLEGTPLTSGIQSPPLVLTDEENATLSITVSAPEYHPSVYTIYTIRERTKQPSGFVRTFLLVLTGLLLLAVVVFLAYTVYLCAVSGRERGWWPLRYPLREPTPTDYTPIAEAAAGAAAGTSPKPGETSQLRGTAP